MDLFDHIVQRTRAFCARFGVQIPILNAPMALVTTPKMAASVSNAGGLGVLCGDFLSPQELEDEIRQTRTLTKRPFAVNLRPPTKNQVIQDDAVGRVQLALGDLMRDLGLDPHVALLPWPSFEEQLEVVLAQHVHVVTTSCGALREIWSDKLAKAGIEVMTAATTLREAKVVRVAGAGAVIVQGAEAGGPRLGFEDVDGCVGLLSLIGPAARATKLPIVAAGGIATGAQMAAALVAGASAVQVGTLLLPSPQSAASDQFKQMTSFSVDSSSVFTDIYSGRLERVLSNGLIDAMRDAGLVAASYPSQWRLMSRIAQAAVACGREDLLCMPVGQSVQLASALDVGKTVEKLVRECEEILGGKFSLLASQ